MHPCHYTRNKCRACCTRGSCRTSLTHPRPTHTHTTPARPPAPPTPPPHTRTTHLRNKHSPQTLHEFVIDVGSSPGPCQHQRKLITATEPREPWLRNYMQSHATAARRPRKQRFRVSARKAPLATEPAERCASLRCATLYWHAQNRQRAQTKATLGQRNNLLSAALRIAWNAQ